MTPAGEYDDPERVAGAHLFVNQDPVGRAIRISFGPSQQSPEYTVIGVAADVKK